MYPIGYNPSGNNEIGDTVGSNSLSIAKANLPNYTLYNGSHSHGVTDPGHTHSRGGYTYTTDHGNNPSLCGSGTPGNTLTMNSSKTGISVNNTTIKVDSGGSGTPLDNRPSSKVVAYWVRVA